MEEVLFLLNAHHNCIWINTYEEQHALNDIREIIAEHFRMWRLYVWSNTEGMKSLSIAKNQKPVAADKKLREVPALFDTIRNMVNEAENSDTKGTNAVFVLRDLHNLMQDPRTRRCIRDIKEYHHDKSYFPIIVIAPSSEINDEVAKLFRVVDYGLPSREEIRKYIECANGRMRKAITEKGKTEYQLVKDDEYDKLVNACIGLTANEIDNVLVRSMVKLKKLDIDYILQDKIEAVKKTGLLDYKQPKAKLADIGGHNVLKSYIDEIKYQMTPEAREFGLEPPKGALFLGIAGNGKTQMAEAIAGELGVPMLMLNMAHVMDRLVGNSEKKIENALAVAKATAPCVMLLDEVEKMLGSQIKPPTMAKPIEDHRKIEWN